MMCHFFLLASPLLDLICPGRQRTPVEVLVVILQLLLLLCYYYVSESAADQVHKLLISTHQNHALQSINNQNERIPIFQMMKDTMAVRTTLQQ